MLEKLPDENEILTLIKPPLFSVWEALRRFIEEKYDIESTWNAGGKAWDYEYKYRRGGKTLCAIYMKKQSLGFLVILGRQEREKFEAEEDSYTEEVQKLYRDTETYHDGKWLMLELTDISLFSDIEKLLLLKRKPNKK